MNNNSFNDVEIFLRLHGRLPENNKDNLQKDDYKKYCDMVMKGDKCPRGRTYELDGLWQYSWAMYKENHDTT